MWTCVMCIWIWFEMMRNVFRFLFKMGLMMACGVRLTSRLRRDWIVEWLRSRSISNDVCLGNRAVSHIRHCSPGSSEKKVHKRCRAALSGFTCPPWIRQWKIYILYTSWVWHNVRVDVVSWVEQMSIIGFSTHRASSEMCKSPCCVCDWIAQPTGALIEQCRKRALNWDYPRYTQCWYFHATWIQCNSIITCPNKVLTMVMEWDSSQDVICTPQTI